MIELETNAKFQKMLDKDYPLCRDDVIWMLQYIKKKAADGDSALLNLPQPRLLNNFHAFAEVALCLIQRGSYNTLEAHQMRKWLTDASFGLTRKP